MRVSLNWLLEFVDLPTRDATELSRSLAMLGHEVEGVEHVDADWTGVVIAHVDAVEPHPNADKVRLCTVSTGGEPIPVVCGAWNFEAGAKVAFAQPGAVLPGDFEIGVRTIRGVESHGMICSEKELDLGEDADGIMVLADDAPVGERLEKLLAYPDVIFDLSITTNRPDAMSILGVARDLAAWYDTPLRQPDPRPSTGGGKTGLSVDIQDPDGNPRFVARRVDGVTVRPSPLWMRSRLRDAGIRPISNLVDVTNYVMLELGQPLHVFDLERISGDTLFVRRAGDGETLLTLDGVERKLESSDIVICDADGPISLAGTMGGETTEVSGTTTSTLIEAASWHPPSILHTSRNHGLRSEASARFERGVDPNLPPVSATRAAQLILETAGGELREEVVDVVAVPFTPTEIALSAADVTRILGSGFDTPRITSLLERLGFLVADGDPLHVTVPGYRPDVTRPIDLVEEIARLSDYDTFPERLRPGLGGGLTVEQTMARRARRSLVSLGFSQAMSLPFVTPAEVEAFEGSATTDPTEPLRVKNPLSEEEAILRPTLLPGLIRAIRQNRNRGRENVALFEIGRVFQARPWEEDPRVPEQPTRLAAVAAGVAGARDLAGEGRSADAHTALAAVRHLAASLQLDIAIRQGSAPGFHPTRTAAISAGHRTIGYAGELHPLTARALDLSGRVAVLELDLNPLLTARRPTTYTPVSPYPPADFDLSFELDTETPASALEQAVRLGGETLVEAVEFFDHYTGPGLDGGRKALALRIRLRAADRTLQADEIAEVRARMIESAAAVGASLRGAS